MKNKKENKFTFVSGFGRCKNCESFMTQKCTRQIKTIYGGCSDEFVQIKKGGIIWKR